MTTTTRAALAVSLLLTSTAAAQEPPPEPAVPEPPAEPAPPEAPAEPAAPAEAPPAAPPPPPAVEREAPAAGVAQPEGGQVAVGLDEPEEPRVAGYDDGFFIQSPDENYRLLIGGYTQFRFTYHAIDGEEDELFFSIPRMRIVLSGHLFTKAFTYKVAVDFGNGTIPSLKDGYADFAAIKDVLHFQAGSYKMPFSRHQLTSSTKLDMVDRAPTNSAFGAGRDLGVMIHNKSKNFIEYAVGVFNGYGEVGDITGDVSGTADATGNVTGEIEDVEVTNVPARLKPRLVGRIGYNHAGIDGYNELDGEGGAPRFAIAANTKLQFNADHADEGLVDLGGDFIVKLFHATVHGGAYVRWAQSGGTFTPSSLEYDSVGFRVGANYLLDDTIWFAGRYALVMPRGADTETHEILGGIGAFAFDQHLRSVLDAGPIIMDDPAGHRIDWRVRTQLQFQL